jgi:hypothetical protein
MKIDRYTKMILIVIALTLGMLGCQNAFKMKSATAAAGITRVAICDTTGQYCADVRPSVNGLGEDIGVRLFTR